MKFNLPEIENKILEFWKKKKIFEKSLKKTERGPNFVFFEGPPTANAKPGIHHVLARALKDIICRYKTMKGFKVLRKAGWDTHGLPVELEIEKKLGLKTKKDIEKYGIAEFNKKCKESVWEYKKDWEKLTERIGYWLDMENPYITYEPEYIESVWWILKEIFKKGLLFQDYKVAPYCPRCGTSLSSHEVALGYKIVKENSIYVKFPLKGEKNIYLLVWTTTPWTLPGNVAVAVNPEFAYIKIKTDNEYLILAKERLNILNKDYEIIDEVKGKDLLGLKYAPLFDFYASKYESKRIYEVITGDFVSLGEGTGLVHIAPAFGEEDMEAAKSEFPILLTVNEEGKMKTPSYGWDGLFVKDADSLITENLKERKLLYKEEMYEHEYPFCWRCDSPLLYYAKTSWFIKTTKVREDLIKNNKKINWVPKNLKEGRFGEWLRDIKDWNLSRERYWGTPLPIWICEKCKKQVCIGSREELRDLQIKKRELEDLHRPHIDEAVLKCECGEQMKRTSEVIDCWFDSGSMPYAQWHYPFENKEKIEKGASFPADYICEGIDQTRGWFYTLLAISTLLGLGISYKNVVSHGIVLDAKGKKMSKSKGNTVVPSEVIDKFGADCIRFYFYTINPVAEAKKFNLKDLENLSRKFFDTLWQSYNFFLTYRDENFEPKKNFQSKNPLDRWIISRLENLNQKLIENLDNYDIVSGARLFEGFVDDLSNWHIRCSRKRFQKPESKEVKEEASQVLYYSLLKLAKMLSPFTPFIVEELYQKLGGKEESVHLSDYPKPEKKLIDKKLEEEMKKVREIVTRTLGERVKAGIKVRQPLLKLTIDKRLEKEFLGLIKEEVNVKEIDFGKELKLDTGITPELKEEGIVREVIRNLQEMRKKIGLKPHYRILIGYSSVSDLTEILNKNKKFILNETKADDFTEKEKIKTRFDLEKETMVDGKKLFLTIKKI